MASLRNNDCGGDRRPAVRRVLALVALLAVAWPATAQRLLDEARRQMVRRDVEGAGIKNAAVIEAMLATPRHEFVPRTSRQLAYYDMALPIGGDQTISPPFIVAYMTEQLEPQSDDRVLEIGTGSGYQAAVLSHLVHDVYTIEIVKSLGRRAAADLRRLRYENVHTRIGDGYLGWPEAAPFDKIIVTCSPQEVPPALIEQLREGGRMIVPLGETYQQTFYLFRKEEGQLVTEALRPTFFVPMTGRAQQDRSEDAPSHLGIHNGGFEETQDDSDAPASWYYQRQLTRVADPNAPDGDHFVRFKNDQPGRAAQALQALGVDGRRYTRLQLSIWIRTSGVRAGQNRHQLPALTIIYYDDRRADLGTTMLGPWRGNLSWQQYVQVVAVPPRAREAVVRVGLLGAVGTLDIDDIRVQFPGAVRE